MDRGRRRTQEKGRAKVADRLFKKPAGLFEAVDMTTRDYPSWMTRAFVNNRYVVMIDDHAKTDKGTAIKAMIQRHDDSPIPGHWMELQNIKNELFGKETTGIEYYPAEGRLINDHNIYWLWIFPESLIPIPV